MYVVKDSKGNIVAYASRKKDAEAIISTKLDKETYTCSQMNFSQTAQSQQS
jgi:hypothetical protein